MRVGVQWSLAAPEDWRWVAVTGHRQRWASLPKKPEPDGAVLDGEPGWVCGLLCQGIVMRGFDHYAVEVVTDPAWGEGLRFTLWQDGPDFAAGTRWATVWELFEPGPDPALGGAVNTRQRRTVYAEAKARHPEPDRPWSEFVPPAEKHVRHGVWMSDEAFAAHQSAAPARGWREWVS